VLKMGASMRVLDTEIEEYSPQFFHPDKDLE
jgi:hypothetical protein